MKPKISEISEFHYTRLGWIRRSHRFNVSVLIYEGYSTIDSSARVGNAVNTRITSVDGQSFSEYCRHLPVPVFHWFPDAVETYTLDDGFNGQELEFFQVSDVFFYSSLSAFEVASWIESTICDFMKNVEDFHSIFCSPTLLIKHGFELLSRIIDRYPMWSPQAGACLAMVGLGAVALWENRRCVCCFRTAVWGISLCGLHSQSKHVSGDISSNRKKNYVNARNTKKLFRHLDWSSNPPLGFYACTWVNMIAGGVLYELSEEDYRVWISDVKRALEYSPLVVSKLPSDFLSRRANEQLFCLRQVIDPFEYVPGNWATKIQTAEQWFHAESQFSKGRRKGPQSKTVDLQRTATELFKLGWKRSEVADHLGISRSHLSHVIKRVK